MYGIIKYLFGEKRTHQTIEQAIRDSFPSVAEKILTTKSLDFEVLQHLLEECINQDLGTEGFNQDYMTLITVSFTAYLKIIHQESDKKEKIVRYLNELLTSILKSTF